jgi:hypothetical protein
MKTPELLWLAIFMILDAISTFDGFVTHYIFGWWSFDLNPIISNLLLPWWPPSLLLFFIVSFALCLGLNWFILKYHPEHHTYFRGMLAFFIIFEAIAVINNVWIMLDWQYQGWLFEKEFRASL